jgi:hypothetical protein
LTRFIKKKPVIDGLFSFSAFVAERAMSANDDFGTAHWAPYCTFLKLEAYPMLRLVMIYLFQWFKRLASNAVSRNGDDTYTENFSSHKDSDSGRWTFVSLFIVFTLSIYSLAGLGYYAKVHVWDGFTEAEKTNIAQAMVVASQNLN